MKIIFLKDVPRIGKRYEIKEVAAGYGRHLISQNAAELATPKAISQIEKKMLTDAAQKKVHMDLLMKNLESINGVKITLHRKANEKGHLFASIHKEEILAELKAGAHLEMHPDYIVLEKPLKMTGTYDIPVVIGEKNSSFTVIIEGK